MLLEELHKKKKITIKNIEGQNGEVLELTIKSYHPNTGEELQPQKQLTGTKEQLLAQKAKAETDLANVLFLLDVF